MRWIMPDSGTLGSEYDQRKRQRLDPRVQLGKDSLAVTVDQQWANRTDLEAEAREAVTLMFEAFYLSPGT